MLIEQLDELLETKPFRPFEVVTSDGRSVRVKSPEFIWHPPASRMIWVYSDRGDFAHLIDLHLVTQFVVTTANGQAGSKRRRRPE